jgi:hypothetical protein
MLRLSHPFKHSNQANESVRGELGEIRSGRHARDAATVLSSMLPNPVNIV